MGNGGGVVYLEKCRILLKYAEGYIPITPKNYAAKDGAKPLISTSPVGVIHSKVRLLLIILHFIPEPKDHLHSDQHDNNPLQPRPMLPA